MSVTHYGPTHLLRAFSFSLFSFSHFAPEMNVNGGKKKDGASPGSVSKFK